MKLTRHHYAHPDPERLARFFLGKRLCARSEEGLVAGLIWETEAYGGCEDKACHGYGGRRTPRTEIMFGPGGFAYVYFTYGMHHLLNFVTGEEGEPKAVLIRAVWITDGVDLARRRRKWTTGKPHAWLADGPAKVCQAFGLDLAHNRLDLSGDRLWVEETGLRPRPRDITASPRVGIDYAGEWVHKPWRFIWTGVRQVAEG